MKPSKGFVENSKKDRFKDRKMARRAKQAMTDWEKSPTDMGMDAPAFACGGPVKKYATGGQVARGCGAAIRGKNYG